MMADTKDTIGSQGAVDALVADTLASLTDSDITSVCEYGLAFKTALTSVSLPSCTKVGAYGFANDSALTEVDMLGGGTIFADAFHGCTSLTSLVLRSTTMTVPSFTNAFEGAPISWGQGAVYVPTSMVDTYKANDSWGTFLIADIADYPLSSYETISDSWSDIITACGNGTYDSKYVVGDIKSIVIDGSTYYMQLVAKDADVLDSDGTTTVPTTWVMWKKVYATQHRMNPDNSSGAQGTGANGGWEHSEMRSWLSGTVLPLLPSEVQAAVKEVRKYSDYIVSGESTVTHDQRTADKLWIPSAREVLGTTSYEQTGPDYTAVLGSQTKRVKYNIMNSAVTWWLRSANSVANFRYVSYGGGVGSNGTSIPYGVALGFCI